jgi:hypothetical protein
MADSTDAPLGSAFLERALPSRERDSLKQEALVYFVEELNCHGDRLRFLARQPPDDSIAQQMEEIWIRCEDLVRALGWNAEEAVRRTWRLLEAPLQWPEDAFGPAWILHALECDTARYRQWRAALPIAAHEAIQLLLDRVEHKYGPIAL